MSDLLLDIDSDGSGADLVIENGDLKLDHGLRTLILVSLFTDGRAPQLPGAAPLAVGDDPRGYWADHPGERAGSLLWQLERQPMSEALAADFAARAAAALQWLVEEGIAESVTCTAEIAASGDRVDAQLVITRGRATRHQALFDAEVEAIEAEAATFHVSLVGAPLRSLPG